MRYGKMLLDNSWTVDTGRCSRRDLRRWRREDAAGNGREAVLWAMGYVVPPQAAKSLCSPDKEGDKGGIVWTANLQGRPNRKGNEYRLASSTTRARPECEDVSLSARGHRPSAGAPCR